ncbi:hypothetical protein [Chryseobacterium sp. Leaf405]|uniref:hypothetical protein n=1 Tax=Chryseobacterium sp. Leaf405 TaxID=1736367 RepID=UPI000A9D1DFD|nr:hypothetical protein [Chryseobacterium sp. Leaf405]
MRVVYNGSKGGSQKCMANIEYLQTQSVARKFRLYDDDQANDGNEINKVLDITHQISS